MIFTAGLAADILFYSCCEWILYASDPHTAEMGPLHDWAATFPLFHWDRSLGFLSGACPQPSASCSMSSANGHAEISEACRPVLG
ncbi:MAG: BCCT family transporter [Clostridium sp.]